MKSLDWTPSEFEVLGPSLNGRLRIQAESKQSQIFEFKLKLDVSSSFSFIPSQKIEMKARCYLSLSGRSMGQTSLTRLNPIDLEVIDEIKDVKRKCEFKNTGINLTKIESNQNPEHHFIPSNIENCLTPPVYLWRLDKKLQAEETQIFTGKNIYNIESHWLSSDEALLKLQGTRHQLTAEYSHRGLQSLIYKAIPLTKIQLARI